MIKTNIGRKDIFATAHSIAQFFDDAGHLLIGLHRKWHPGLRRLSKNLARLKVLPPDYVSLMEKALDPVSLFQWDDLEDILNQLYSDIRTLCAQK